MVTLSVTRAEAEVIIHALILRNTDFCDALANALMGQVGRQEY